MSEPIPITMADLPQLIRELSMAGARELGFEDVNGVRYITAASHPGTRWFVTDAGSEDVRSSPVSEVMVGPAPGLKQREGQLIVEIHFPLVPASSVPQNGFQFPWIMEVQDRLATLTLESDGAEDYDDGEQLGDTYAFFLTGEDRTAVLAAAKKIATGPDLPTGAFLIINDADGDMGQGERVELSEIP